MYIWLSKILSSIIKSRWIDSGLNMLWLGIFILILHLISPEVCQSYGTLALLVFVVLYGLYNRGVGFWGGLTRKDG